MNLNDDDRNNSRCKKQNKIEKIRHLVHLRHFGNDVHSFTLKLKENRTIGLPLYVTDEGTRFWFICVKLVPIARSMCVCVS